MIEEESFVNNANSAIRRDLWEQHQFDEGLPGLEDGEWAKHWLWRNLAVRYEAKACIIHVHTESWAQVRHRFHREGMAGRWAHLRLVRHIPREIAQELVWCIAGGICGSPHATSGAFRALSGQILRYRSTTVSTVGIVGGILDSRKIDNPSQRAPLFYEWRYPAVVVRGPNDSAIQERVIPQLKPSEVLVRVAYVGICGTDLELFEGRLGYYKSGMAKYPIVPGHESSGTAVSIGTKVTITARGRFESSRGVHPGMRCVRGVPAGQRDHFVAEERREVGVIACSGRRIRRLSSRRCSHVMSIVVPERRHARHKQRWSSRSRSSSRRCAGLPPASAAPEPRRCAIVGAGTIGNLAARDALALRGHHVTVFDRELARLSTFDGIAATSTSLVELDRFDWLIEATGDQAALSALLNQSRTGATLLLLGFPYESQSFSFESIVGFDRTVVGSVGSSGADFDEALTTLPLLDTSAFLKLSYPLEEYAIALRAVRAREHIKVMLRVDPTAL